MSWRAEYRASLKMIEVEEFFDLIFYRPLAFLVVKTIARTSLTPNQVTLIAMVVGIVAGVCFAVGTPGAWIAAALLLVVYDVLDCADGQLARLKNNGTRIGRILDGFIDYIVSVAAYVGIGIGFASASDQPLFWWVMLVAAGASYAVHAVLVDYYRNRFLDVVLQRRSTFDADIAAFEQDYARMQREGGHMVERLLIAVYLVYSRVQRRMTSGDRPHGHLATADPTTYYHRNRVVLRFWLLLGPTTQITVLVICALIGRFDVYVFGLVIVGNLWALVLLPFQRRIDRQLKTRHAVEIVE
ncbi:MAG: CDP-alcohol phosphatidyltransferase family protein [Bacteroidota bacterium]|jgi:phosphatidylglycerophosphate synthase|nr:CDP-alcohol phosphatidyltransferase family protein [Bacteroidota bacterium]